MTVPKSWLPIIWEKGCVDPNFDPDEFRFDAYELLMKYSEYGNTDCIFGWEVDHIVPVSKGGRTELSNLRPLNWKSNREKADC